MSGRGTSYKDKRSMPAKKSFDAALIKIIEDEIAKDPFELYGQKWAVVAGDGQAGLANHLGVSTSVLKRRLKGPPFKRRAKIIKGERCTLLRIREPGEPAFTAEEQRDKKANEDRKAMIDVWQAKTKKKPTYDQGALMWGFARDLADFPGVDPVEVFSSSLNYWPHTASAIKLAAEATPGWKARFLDFPEIGYIRRFYKAVINAYVSRLMEAGKVPADKLTAFAAILQATDFEPIPDDVPFYEEEHVSALMTKKAEKIAAKKAAKSAVIAA